MFSTRWLGDALRRRSGTGLAVAALGSYVRHWIRHGRLRQRIRTVELVRQIYDSSRQELIDRSDPLTLEEMTLGSAEDIDWVLLDDSVVYQSMSQPTARILETLASFMGGDSAADAKHTVVEFGSGDGRNLLFLKTRFPNINFIGLELSPVSTELSQRAARRFGLNVEFHTCDITEGVPASLLPGSADLVFSFHALEQVPRIFPKALENMLTVASREVVFFEPIEELWPWTLRGIVSRLRVRHLDRLRGFLPELRAIARHKGWTLIQSQRLKVGSNPLNETCLAVLVREGN